MAVRQLDRKFLQLVYNWQDRALLQEKEDLAVSSLFKLDNAHYWTGKAPAL